MHTPTLVLRPGPHLVVEESLYRPDFECTEAAHRYLSTPIRLGQGVTFADLLRLLRADETLLAVYQKFPVQGWLEQCADSTTRPAPAPNDSQGVEYLEIFQQWGFNSHTRTVHPAAPSLRGVGFELQEDTQVAGLTYPKGTRIEWSLTFAEARELLALEVRVSPSVVLVEDDIDSIRYGRPVQGISVEAPCLTLGDVLETVFQGLSMLGGPAEQQAVRKTLEARMDAAVSKGECAGIPLDDYFARVYGCAIKALFSDLGSFPEGGVFGLVRKVDDDEPVQVGIDRILLARGLPPGVKVMPEHASLCGRDFRQLFREARRLSRTGEKRSPT